MPEAETPDSGVLPEGWDYLKIGNFGFVTKLAGFEFTKFFNYQDEGEVRVVRILNIGFGNFIPENFKFIDRLTSSNLSRSQLSHGDILISYVGSIGKAAILPNDGYLYHLGPNVAKIVVNSMICDSRYLLNYILSPEGQEQLNTTSKAVTQSSLSMKQIRSVIVPLPPLPEQQRIVARIEGLLAHVNEARGRLQKVPVIMKQFRQGVLAAACSGRLTEGWREENPNIPSAFDDITELCSSRKQKPKKHFEKSPTSLPKEIDVDNVDIPDSWCLANVGFLGFVTKLAGFEYTKYFHLSDSGDIPVVRAQNVQMGKFVNSNIKFIPLETSNILERSQLNGNEILIVYVGAGVGNVCLAPSEGRWHLSSNVGKIELDWMVNKYLLFYLQSEFGLNKILSVSKATAQPSLSMGAIRDTVVYVPPLAEQHEIVRRVDALFARAEAVEREAAAATKRAETLTQAVLGKAFRGELVTTGEG